MLLGDFEAVLGMIEDVTPTGDVRVLPLDPSDPLGLVAVVFSGNLDVRLDRSQLLASQATFLFSPGEALVGASGQARFDGRLGLPFVVQGNVPLPYASAFTASGAHLYGFQASGGESMARIVASSSASDVVVRLRSR